MFMQMRHRGRSSGPPWQGWRVEVPQILGGVLVVVGVPLLIVWALWLALGE